ncbi:unnamed protein product [Cladocopium goreaui]|uniref:Uncharacterized protein n=1 Tax=Cladocopium goreaui TaxID=2562237 RepID=A0A9P1DIH9_9DINO|nr:unnamed protein product [Cladocopium goreaui]
MEKSEQNSRSQEMEQSERHSQRMPAMHHSKEKNDESLHAANRSELENVTEHKEQRYSSNRAQSRSRSAPREDNEKEARSQSLGLPHSRRARRPHHRRRYTRRVSRCPSPHRCRPADYALRRAALAAEVACHDEGGQR